MPGKLSLRLDGPGRPGGISGPAGDGGRDRKPQRPGARAERLDGPPGRGRARAGGLGPRPDPADGEAQARSRSGRSTRRPATSSARATAATSGSAGTSRARRLHLPRRVAVHAVPGKKGYNSGIYARNSADARIWHQAQTGDASGGYLFGETDVNGEAQADQPREAVRDSRVKPAGEWKTFEIACKGQDMTLWVNGAVTNGGRLPGAQGLRRPRGRGLADRVPQREAQAVGLSEPVRRERKPSVPAG